MIRAYTWRLCSILSTFNFEKLSILTFLKSVFNIFFDTNHQCVTHFYYCHLLIKIFLVFSTSQAEAYSKLESADESRKQAVDSVEKLRAELYATKVLSNNLTLILYALICTIKWFSLLKCHHYCHSRFLDIKHCSLQVISGTL